MKVLVINTNVMVYDGIMTAIFNYVENMDLSDCHIDFIAINNLESSIYNRINKINANLYVLPYRNKNPFKYVIELSKIIRKNKYNIVHVHGSSCIMAIELLASKLAGVPCCPHSHSTNCQHKRIHQILKPLFYFLYKNGFACGEEAGHWLYGKRKFDVINNGINVDKFRFNQEYRDEYRKKYNISNKDTAIIQIAHFSKVKNHVFLIDVFKKVIEKNKNYKLLLLGDGELRKDIEQQVYREGLEDKVIFIGITQEVAQILSACDLMVLPSLYEGFPFSIVEAQVSGIQCLVSNQITRKCQFSNYFEYIELNEKLWVNKIIESSVTYNRKEISLQNIKNIEVAGYDIKVNTEKLKKLYKKYAK